MKDVVMNLGTLEATDTLGAALASALRGGLTLTLTGDLGAGKTTLTRAVLRALGVTGSVKSPSYALVEEYPLKDFTFYHFDFYRMQDPSEFSDGGFAEYFRDDSVCVVEWAEKVGDELPPVDCDIRLEHVGEHERKATFRALTPRGEALIQALPT
jgi:tRNA threonylcarbamoyladenosine biosynthesis protein TsaE